MISVVCFLPQIFTLILIKKKKREREKKRDAVIQSDFKCRLVTLKVRQKDQTWDADAV